MNSITLENADINDVFENIAFSEEIIIREGFQEGLKKGIEEGKQEGYHLGFHKGVELGYELGYYGGVVDFLLQSHRIEKREITERVYQILVKLKSLIFNYPRINCSNTDEKMESTKTTLETYLDFLIPFLPLANSHTVDFIVKDAWNKLVPESVKTEVLHYGVDHILDSVRTGRDCHLLKFVRTAEMHVVENYPGFRNIKSLNFPDVVDLVRVDEFMTSKKQHEVECMSKIVANVADICDTNVIVDVGSGKGYLSSILALRYRLRVLGLDSKQTIVSGAVRTTTYLERKWPVYNKSSGNESMKAPRQIVKAFCASNEEYYEKYKWKSAVVGDLFKSRVENVSDSTNLKTVLAEEYPHLREHKVLLTGLHTCGNLAADSLRLFIENTDIIESVINVSCCYHLIDEEFVDSPAWHRTEDVTRSSSVSGFPMSVFLKEKRFSLGRDARMCGTQNPSKIFADYDVTGATRPLFYRALLQELLEKTQKPNDLPSCIVGRIAHKCNSFQEYAGKALTKLNIRIDMSEEELNMFFHQYNDHWGKLKVFFLLKTALSPVLESVILLDRLLYLYEKGIGNAFVTRLFDPYVSPRCYALVAFRDSSASTTNTKY